MEVFISWSGVKGRFVAEALREWLPYLLHDIQPWISSGDIHPGTRWNVGIAEKLDQAHYGIVCVTRESLNSRWLHFEAGALAKSIEKARVIPYLVDVEIAEVQGPLIQFQATEASKESTWKLLNSLNDVTEHDTKVPRHRLRRLFEKFWPDLEKQLSKAPEDSAESRPSRSDRSILEELLESTRLTSRITSSLSRNVRRLEVAVSNQSTTEGEQPQTTQSYQPDPLSTYRSDITISAPPHYRPQRTVWYYKRPHSTFQSLLDAVYTEVLPESIPPYSYGEAWQLVDSLTGEVFIKSENRDLRSLEELGIHPGSKLLVTMIAPSSDDLLGYDG